MKGPLVPRGRVRAGSTHAELWPATPTLTQPSPASGRGLGFGRGAWIVALGAVIFLCLAAGRLSVPAGEYGDLSPAAAHRYVGAILAAGAVYLAGVRLIQAWAVPRWALLAGLTCGVAARLVLVATPPVMSTDLYRYVWDGRVQAAGINPYRYLPSDPAIAFLRDGRTGPEAVFININRPETAKTIYPPAAQLLFAAIGATASSMWTIKAVMLVFDLLAGWAAWRLLRHAGRPDAWLLIWAWNPLAITEFAGAGHVDAAALAISGLALLFATRRQPALAGAALGVAALCKLLPVSLGPAIWRPRTLRAPAAALAVVAAGYAIYSSVGLDVFGYLSGYAAEEGLEQGSGFLLLRLVALATRLPPWAGIAYVLAAFACLDLLALWMLRRPGAPRADVMARDALLLSAALLFFLSPHYPWYLTMLVVPCVVVPRLGAIWPTVAGPLLYWDADLHSPWWSAIVFLPMAVWLGIELSKRVQDA